MFEFCKQDEINQLFICNLIELQYPSECNNFIIALNLIILLKIHTVNAKCRCTD